jgi:hypothetical protein
LTFSRWFFIRPAIIFASKRASSSIGQPTDVLAAA